MSAIQAKMKFYALYLIQFTVKPPLIKQKRIKKPPSIKEPAVINVSK